MAHYDDMQELLTDVSRLRGELEKQYQDARTDPEIKTVLRPAVKSALEQLRSALEYSAYGLYEKYCTATMNERNVYFPYALEEAAFNLRMDACLKGLPAACPGAADAIRSIQPFACGDDWLPNLCNQTNFLKHKGLGEIARENSPHSALSLGNIFRATNSNITFGEIVVNGVRVNAGGPVRVSPATTRVELQNQLIEPAKHLATQEFEYVKFMFAKTAEDTLELIGKAHDGIATYAEAVKPYL
ncbi:hypothetical protein QZM82_06385 [Burkholderia cepacia]|uniref:hypothetical protein n=1 Tax=Burkholderia cepacia TaxID=292 RepID=UPI0026572853|nr:hypothetical protein [Burkholderia cepacia]MDN7895820.1 hypothetical protein [Burkholderia cepacia]